MFNGVNGSICVGGTMSSGDKVNFSMFNRLPKNLKIKHYLKKIELFFNNYSSATIFQKEAWIIVF